MCLGVDQGGRRRAGLGEQAEHGGGGGVEGGGVAEVGAREHGSHAQPQRESEPEVQARHVSDGRVCGDDEQRVVGRVCGESVERCLEEALLSAQVKYYRQLDGLLDDLAAGGRVELIRVEEHALRVEAEHLL